MKYINIIDKLKLLFELIAGNYLFIGLLVISLVLFVINRFKLINNKKTGLIITLTFILSFSIILFFNSNTLFKTFDNISNLIFKNIYFPSVYVYIGIILITDIILIMSILSNNMPKLYKSINIGVSFVINFLLLVLLNTIGSNEIDILSVNSLYTNNYIVSLIELTTSTFILWMMSLLLISIINSILVYMDNKNMEVEPIKSIDLSANRVELDIDKEDLQPAYESNNKVLESYPLSNMNIEVKNIDVNNYSNIKSMDNIVELNDTPKQIDNIAQVDTSNGYAFNDLVKRENNNLDELRNNNINDLINVKPVMSYNRVIDDGKNNNVFLSNSYVPESKTLDTHENKYSKEDYKLFYRMLNAVKENNNGNAIVTMDDALSVNLLNKFSIKEYNLYKKMLQDVR